MYNVKETIIVEGRYDKIKLSGFIESPIFVTYGFSIFNNKEAQRAIRTYAKKTGIVILTDSDSAGLKIRAFVKQLVTEGNVFDAYVPEVSGKEKRKTVGGKEGLLGVEGINEAVIMDALKKSGAEVSGERYTEKSKKAITKTDFYMLGLSGGEKSASLRKSLALRLGLPSKISANMLLDTVNRLLTKDELTKMTEEISKEVQRYEEKE